MVLLRIRTREQQFLAIPLIAGILAGLIGVIYLFTIPSDPKNSVLFGFSLFRIFEGLALFVISGVFVGLLIMVLREPDFAIRLFTLFGWNKTNVWSVPAAWIGLLCVLFVAIFGTRIFPAQTLYFERLLPLTIWMGVFFAVFVFTILWWRGRSSFRDTLTSLIKISFIFIAATMAAGLLVFPSITGLMLRQGSLIILLLLSPILFFSFKKSGIVGIFTGLLFIGIIFFGALVGVWASGKTDANIIAGLLPFNDANGYFHGGRLLAEGQLFHPFSAKRPLFPALLGVLYWLSGQNLQVVLGCLTLMLVLAVYLCSRELSSTAGVTAAVFFAFGLFIFIRRFIGSTMSEVLGLPLGVIGFAFLWSSATRRRLTDAAAGLLMLCLGLLSRAGPFFLLPLLIIWAGMTFRKNEKINWKAVVYLTMAALLGYVIHLVIFTYLSGDNSSSMSNFSYTLYGLVVGGKGWKQYALDHPDVLSMVEPFGSRAIYQYAWEAFKTNPMGIVQGAIRYWQAFFTFEWSGLFGYIEGATYSESLVGRWVMAILSIAGLVFSIKNIKKPEYSMVLAGIIGILLSVPFVPTMDAEIRTYAAGIPWMIALGMLGLVGLRTWLMGDCVEKVDPAIKNGISYGIWSMAAGLILLIFVAPLLLHAAIKPTDDPAVTVCPAGSAHIITTISKGSYINILPDTSRTQSFVPDLREIDYRQSLHDSPMYEYARQMLKIKPGYSFFTAYNSEERLFEDIVGKTELFEAYQGRVELCGWHELHESGTKTFMAESARRLDK
jgi:hypothetical protein